MTTAKSPTAKKAAAKAVCFVGERGLPRTRGRVSRVKDATPWPWPQFKLQGTPDRRGWEHMEAPAQCLRAVQ